MNAAWIVMAAGIMASVAQAALVPTSSPHRPSVTAAGDSYSPVFSPDGRYIAFVSHAGNLVTNDSVGPSLNLYLRDLITSNNVLISVSTNGVEGANDNVRNAALSAIAGRIAYESTANNLTSGDDNNTSDIYVRDVSLGQNILVSVKANGTGPGNGPSFRPQLSSDGRFVVFESLASNLVTNDFNGTNDIFIRDLLLGTTALVSVNADGTSSPDGLSHSPSLSADGTIIAFVSHATNLVAGVTNRLGEIYVRHINSGTNQWVTASHLLSTWTRWPPSGLAYYYQADAPVLSADGRFVMFKTGESTVRFDLLRPPHSIFHLSTNAEVNSFNFDDNPRVVLFAASLLAADPSGRSLAFEPTNATSGYSGIVRVDWETLETNVTICCPGLRPHGYYTNVAPAVELVVTNSMTAGKRTWTSLTSLSYSAPGHRLLFLANANGLVPDVTNSTRQVYAVDVSIKEVRLVSTNRAGLPGPDLGGIGPSLSIDGSTVAWESVDADVVDGDGNGAWDVFALATSDGQPKPISEPHPERIASTAAGLSRGHSLALSANGRYVAFVSTDSTLVEDDENRGEDIFIYDTVSGAKTRVASMTGSTSHAEGPILSPDGRFLTFALQSRNFGQTNRSVFWTDLSIPTNRNITSALWPAAMTSDGRYIAYTQVELSKADIHILALGAPVAGPPASNPVLISTTPDNLSRGNSSSILPTFSPDGKWIVFQSLSTSLVAEYPVVSPVFQLYARPVRCDVAECGDAAFALPVYRGPTRLVSAGPALAGVDEPLPGGGANPVFSANSRYVAFESDSNTIFRHDLQAPMMATLIEQNGTLLTNYSRKANVVVCTNCTAPSLDATGTLAVFEERVPGGTNIIARNLVTGENELISRALGGSSGNASSIDPAVSHDGRFVVFTSLANNLAANDTNGVNDVFLRDRWNGVTHCLSLNWRGTATGNRISAGPILSANGRTIAFHSFADDLIPRDHNDYRDVFVVTLAGEDTDNDGMDDDLEMAYFDTLARNGDGDFDSDGMSDALEIRSGTNPADDSSVFGVLAISTAYFGSDTSAFRTTAMTWRTTPGRRYQVQHRASLESPNWEDVGAEVISQGTTASQLHTTPGTAGSPLAGFYRVKLVD